MDIQTELTQLSQDIQRLRSKLETGEATRGYNLALDRVLKAIQTRAAGIERRDRRGMGGVETLHACPFCDCLLNPENVEEISMGGKPPEYQVFCPACNARGGQRLEREYAIRAWNGVAMTFQALGKRHGN